MSLNFKSAVKDTATDVLSKTIQALTGAEEKQ